MSYQEKRTIVNIATGLLVLAIYFIDTLGRYRSGAIALDDLESWAVAMLIFIGIYIAISIIIQIIFHILLAISLAAQKKIQDKTTCEEEIEKSIDLEFTDDEMVKLIELKSMRVGFSFAWIGFIVALVSLALNYPPAVMLNILIVSLFGGSVFSDITQLYYYRKGVR